MAFSQNDKRVLDTFSLRMRTNGYLRASVARFTKNHKSATYELHSISRNYEKLMTMADVSLENIAL